MILLYTRTTIHVLYCSYIVLLYVCFKTAIQTNNKWIVHKCQNITFRIDLYRTRRL